MPFCHESTYENLPTVFDSFFAFSQVHASHFAGGELLYRYVGDSTGIPGSYKVTCILYRDVTGIQLGSTISVGVKTPCTSLSSTTIPIQSITVDSIYDLCNIGGATINTYRYNKHVYSGIINVSAPCTEVTFSFSGNDRNYPDNLCTSNGFYIESTTFIRKNNSCQSAINGPRLFEVNHAVLWPHFFYDNDGDSLFVELSTPRSYNATKAAFCSTFSQSTPVSVSSNIGFQLESSTGNIFFEPDDLQRSVVTLKVSEYRYDSTQMNMVQIAERIVDKTADVVFGNSTNLTPIKLDTTVVNYDCSASYIDLSTNSPFLDFSLSKDATDFIIVNPLGHLVSVDSAIARNYQNFRPDSIRLFLHDSLSMNGLYKIISLVGADGNTLINECNESLNTLDTASFTVSNCPNIGVVENQIEEYEIFPNPVKEDLRIRAIGDGRFIIEIFNSTGQRVYSAKSHQKEMNIKMSSIPSGFYYLKIKDRRKTRIKKIIKH